MSTSNITLSKELKKHAPTVKVDKDFPRRNALFNITRHVLGNSRMDAVPTYSGMSAEFRLNYTKGAQVDDWKELEELIDVYNKAKGSLSFKAPKPISPRVQRAVERRYRDAAILKDVLISGASVNKAMASALGIGWLERAVGDLRRDGLPILANMEQTEYQVHRSVLARVSEVTSDKTRLERMTTYLKHGGVLTHVHPRVHELVKALKKAGLNIRKVNGQLKWRLAH